MSKKAHVGLDGGCFETDFILPLTATFYTVSKASDVLLLNRPNSSPVPPSRLLKLLRATNISRQAFDQQPRHILCNFIRNTSTVWPDVNSFSEQPQEQHSGRD